jgi:hypothetical protein
MTVSESDIIYSYGKIREQLQFWIDQNYTPKAEDLKYTLDSFPGEVGDEDGE